MKLDLGVQWHCGLVHNIAEVFVLWRVGLHKVCDL